MYEQADEEENTSLADRRKVEELLTKNVGEERDPQELERLDKMDLDLADEEEI